MSTAVLRLGQQGSGRAGVGARGGREYLSVPCSNHALGVLRQQVALHEASQEARHAHGQHERHGHDVVHLWIAAPQLCACLKTNSTRALPSRVSGVGSEVHASVAPTASGVVRHHDARLAGNVHDPQVLRGCHAADGVPG